MLSNMASSLILHKRINTTVAKAKALRQYVEPLITKSKTDSTHSRRVVFSYLQDKETVKVLFDEVSEKVNDRPGGYTRIIKTGNRLGDNAEMCIMELVDYNELLLADKAPAKAKTRRSRRGKKSTSAQDTPSAVEDAVVVEDSVVEAEAVEETEAVEDVATENIEEVQVESEAKEVEEEPTKEEKVEEVKAKSADEVSAEAADESEAETKDDSDNEEESKKE